jgi:hypothetical protein
MNAIKELGRRLLVTLIDLATSKKALAAAVGAVLGYVIKDEATRNLMVGSIMSYVLGQSVVDHAKATAEGKLGIAGAQPLPVAVVDSPGASVTNISSPAAPAAK